MCGLYLVIFATYRIRMAGNEVFVGKVSEGGGDETNHSETLE